MNKVSMFPPASGAGRLAAAAAGAVLLLTTAGCGVEVMGQGASSSTSAASSPTAAASPGEPTGAANSSTVQLETSPSAEQSSASTPLNERNYQEWSGQLRQRAGQNLSCNKPVTLVQDATLVALSGHCGTVTVQGAGITVVADEIDTLVTVGDVAVVVARSIARVTIQGSGSEVYWAQGQPEISDSGEVNVARQIPEKP